MSSKPSSADNVTREHSLALEEKAGFYLSGDGEWVPEGWTTFGLGEVYNLRQGRYIKPENLSETKSEEFPSEVIGGNGSRGFTRTIEYNLPQPIVTCRGSGCGLVQLTPPASSITNSSIAFESKFNEMDRFFCYYWAKSENFESVTSGSAQPQITIGALSSKTITLPPLPEQKAIAAVLSSLDDKIELLREQNETLEALAQTLFKRWFIDFNFPDENGNPYKDSGGEMIASELGEIPEGWTVLPAKAILERYTPPRTYTKEDTFDVGKTPVTLHDKN